MPFQHEIILPNEKLPFKIFLFEGKDGNYIRDKHWHNAIEIFAVFEGSLRFFINAAEYPLKQEECIIINSNEVHSIAAHKKNKTVVVQIPLKIFENYYTEEKFIRFQNQGQGGDKKVMRSIEQMYQMYCARDNGYELQVQSVFYQLAYLLVTEYKEDKVKPEEIKRNGKLNRLGIITDYMKENYTGELTLEKVSKEFGYSPTYLSHIFQKYANINFKQYVQSIRMEHAYKELMQTEETIHEIALKNGFANQKAFSVLFQRKYGMPPSEYRKRDEKNNRKFLP